MIDYHEALREMYKGNVVKYVARAGKKDPMKRLEDLHKAMWYLQEEITNEYERSSK